MRRVLALVLLAGLLVGACAAASVPAPEPAPVPGEETSGKDVDRAGDLGPGTNDITDRLIVRVGSLELEVADVPSAYRQVRQLALRLGGYVGDSAFATDMDGRPSATVVLRIPADRYDEALDALRPLASKVVSERSQETDVTAQVVDLDARLRNLRASEEALVRLLDRAAKISEILEVQRELTGVRQQIEQLTAEKQLLERQAALATLTVSLSLSTQPISTAAEGWDLRAELEEAVAQLIDVAQLAARAGIWLVIVGLPILLVGFVLLAVGLRVARRLGLDPRRGRAAPPAGPAAA